MTKQAANRMRAIITPEWIRKFHIDLDAIGPLVRTDPSHANRQTYVHLIQTAVEAFRRDGKGPEQDILAFDIAEHVNETFQGWLNQNTFEMRQLVIVASNSYIAFKGIRPNSAAVPQLETKINKVMEKIFLATAEQVLQASEPNNFQLMIQLAQKHHNFLPLLSQAIDKQQLYLAIAGGDLDLLMGMAFHAASREISVSYNWQANGKPRDGRVANEPLEIFVKNLETFCNPVPYLKSPHNLILARSMAQVTRRLIDFVEKGGVVFTPPFAREIAQENADLRHRLDKISADYPAPIR